MAGNIDREALAQYLDSDLSPDECMGLSDLDGFLTGIVVGPELIMPSEWLPVIWGRRGAGIRIRGPCGNDHRSGYGSLQ